MGRLAVWVALLAGGAAAVSRRRFALTVAVGAALVATLVLVRALVTDDFSLVYVADFSRRGASTPFRVAALWGGMAGSLLWFATLAGLAGWSAAGRVRSTPAAGVVSAVTGGLVAQELQHGRGHPALGVALEFVLRGVGRRGQRP